MAVVDTPAETASPLTSQPWLGRRLDRVEDAALLSGRGRFADDLGSRPGTLHAAVLRSPHAHADIGSIDVDAALALPGVRTVLTGADVRRWARPFVVGVKQPMEHWPLAIERVRYVGEPVAVAIADSRYRAEDALDRIEVGYRPLTAVIDPSEAIGDRAPVLHEAVGSNLISDRRFNYGDPDRAFADADHTIALTVRYPRNSCTPIECYVVVADYRPDDGSYDVLANFQGPFALHPVMALALKVPGSKLRLRIPPDSGGSFGIKQGVFPYVVLMSLAARKAGAPVKWVEDRLEHLAAASSATNRVTTLTAAVQTDGTVTALDYDQLEDCGAYLRAPEPATYYRMHGTLTGAYRIRHLRVRNRIALTNKTPTGLVRGFGGPQVYYALERLMQTIARQLDLDPLEVIRRNLIPAEAFPYQAIAGSLYDSGNYQRGLALAEQQGRLDELKQRRDQARRDGRLYGIGYATIVEPSISNMGYITTVLTADERAKAGPKNGAIASATVNIDPLGSVTVTIESTPQGQGHRTVIAQVVADALGLTPELITVDTELDTRQDGWSIAAGNYSSRFAGAVAGTVHLAAIRIRDKLARIAAQLLKCDADQIVFQDGKLFATDNPDRTLPFHRVAGTGHWSPALLPDGETPALRETAFWTPPQLAAPTEDDVINSSAAYGFVFDICGLEIDRDTGRIQIDRYITLHDAGKLLNPALADGQIRGAFAQGLGAALLEEFNYAADGSFLSGTLADYLLPTSCEVPEPQIIHMETPSPFTSLGAKGLGEGNNMSTPVCIANAVADALDVSDITLPLTPAKVQALIGLPDPPPSRPRSKPAEAAPTGEGQTLSAAGDVEFSATPEQVFEVLLDPDALARVIPGCHELTPIADNRYRADVTVGVGLVKARYRAEIELSEIDPPRSLRLAGSGTSSLGVARGSGRVTLEPTDRGTRLHYDYQAAVSGKVASVGSRMLEGAAGIVLRQLFEALGRQAGGDTAVKTSWWQRLLAWLPGVRS